MPLRDEHHIERHGKTYILLSGLLELAHERGLSATSTELLDYGVDEKGGFTYAICRATVELTDSEGLVKRFTGIGDANRESVGRGIVVHLLRMSETRAIARALRVAVNVGTAAIEELGGDENPSSSSEASSSTRSGAGSQEGTQNPQKQTQQGQKEDTPLVYAATLAKLKELCTQLDENHDAEAAYVKMEKRLGYPMNMLSQEEAEKWEQALRKRLEERRASTPQEASREA